ncbi:MAG: M1 family metallopeptidase [Bacteroidales bacterium]|nr:M1 family metallopeptidase [Bacteroidales bacterium]
MRIIYTLVLTLVFGFELVAQNDYFQQEVNYEIHVTLNDTAHSLSAKIRIEYTNNSPQVLDYLMFHLWPNAYKESSTALGEQFLDMGKTEFYYADDSLRGFIDSLNFMVDGKIIPWSLTDEHIDIAKLKLNKPLNPGETITITTPFYVKIPSSIFSRLGHSGQSYQITQWYPKPAVYDRNGWNAFPYLNQGEFYSEFGSFDVYITVPKNYVIGATGDLVDCKQEEKWLDSIAEVTQRKVRFSDDLEFPDSDSLNKTLHYHQEKVHDFAWFADKRFHVLKGEVVLQFGRKVTTWAMFTNEEVDIWTKSITYLNRSLKFYSQQVGTYPYNQVTAVQGTLSAGAGMEYPNITIIGTAGVARSLDNVIMHEVGHNWFYGMLGFNERAHPWMDEGLNTYIESLYMDKYYPKERLFDVNIFNASDYSKNYEYYFSNLMQWRRNLNQSLSLPAQDFTAMNYGISVYQKTALIFKYLQAYLGEKEARITMRKFFNEWAYKHPLPEDMKLFYEKETGRDLSWVFDDLINTSSNVDYKIASLKKKNSTDSLLVKVRNKGEVVSPFSISALDSDGDVLLTKWYNGFDGTTKVGFPKGDYHRLSIDGDKVMTDVYRENDQVFVNGLLKKRKQFRLKLAWSLPKDDKATLFWTPVIGWNSYNKFMLGAAFYNSLVFEKKWQYSVMPLYSFAQNNVNGSFSLFHNFYDKGQIQRVSVGVTGRKYSIDDKFTVEGGQTYSMSFYRIVPQLIFDFNPRKPSLTSVQKQLRVRAIFVSEDKKYWDPIFPGFAPSPMDGVNEYQVYQIEFTNNNHRIMNPYFYRFDVQGSADFARLTAEFRYRFSYGKKKSSGFDVRLFGGYLHRVNNGLNFAPNLRMAGTAGRNDYLYDGVFAGRNERDGMWSQQMIESDGGFYIPTILGQNAEWLGAINLRASLPKLSFIKVYANLGFQHASLVQLDPLWEAGFLISIIDRKLEVYFPALWSQDIQDVFELNKNTSYGEKIRFTMRMELADPFKYLKEVRF